MPPQVASRRVRAAPAGRAKLDSPQELTSEKVRQDQARAPAHQDFPVPRAVPLSEAGKVRVIGADQIAYH